MNTRSNEHAKEKMQNISYPYLLVGQEYYSVPKVVVLLLTIDPLKIIFIKF